MILVVDADSNFLEQAKQDLSASSPRGIFFANNAKQALEFMRTMEETLSVVLIDLDLPGMNGFELISTVRKEFPGIPVIAISGLLQHSALESAKIFGAAEVLSKPINSDWKTTVARVRATRGSRN
jgi:CheY-like chemotaxis protein